MKDDTVSRAAVMQSLTREYNRRRTGDGLKLAWIEKAVNDVPAVQTCDDAVSRQAAIKTLEKGLPSEPLKSKYTEGITVGFGLAITWIEQLPAVQPQPEIIRCKDCIYYRQEIDMCDEPHSTAHNIVHEDDYCSKAERRTDEQTDQH